MKNTEHMMANRPLLQGISLSKCPHHAIKPSVKTVHINPPWPPFTVAYLYSLTLLAES